MANRKAHIIKDFLLYIWMLPQNIIGFILSRFRKQIMICVNGSIDENENVTVYYTNNVFGCGVSLGNYIILDTKYMNFSHDTTIKHEHGHQKQSRILGWFYLIVIGIPSAFGNLWDRLFHKNWNSKERIAWYYKKLPWEAWADKLGNVQRF